MNHDTLMLTHLPHLLQTKCVGLWFRIALLAQIEVADNLLKWGLVIRSNVSGMSEKLLDKCSIPFKLQPQWKKTYINSLATL